MNSIGIIVDELETVLEAIEEEGGLILNEGFLMLIYQGIMDDLPQFEKYWTHVLQYKSMPVIEKCHSRVLTFDRLCNGIFSP